MQPVGEEPPVDVTALAQTRGFGSRVASRALASPLMTGLGGLVVGAACIGLMFLVGLGVNTTGVVHELLRFVELFLCFGMISALSFAIRSLVRGAQSFHVFAGGFVHRRNGKNRAYAWQEVGALRPVLHRRGDDAGKLRDYQLVPQHGTPISIPLDIVDGRDPFMDHLMGLLDHYGIPVS